MKRLISIISIVAVMAVMALLLPGAVLADTEKNTSGTFTAENGAPTLTSVEVYSEASCTTVATTMTPGSTYFAKVTVGDANTLADLATVKLTLKYVVSGANGADPTGDGANTQTQVNLTYTLSGDVFSIAPSSSSTWVLGVDPSASVPFTSDEKEATTGDCIFAFTVGKVATEAPGGASANAGWGVYARADDAASNDGMWWSGTASAQYTFTISSANATVEATYTNNVQTFTVLGAISGGTTLVTSGTGAPEASGTLTKSGGTGDATITFASVVNDLNIRKGINWYGAVTINSGTAAFGSVALGCIDVASSSISTTYVSNGNYSEEVKSSTPWTATLGSVALKATGSPGSGQFSLKADDDATVDGAVQIGSASYADIATDAGLSSETGNTTANNTLFLSLGSSGIPVGEYTGTVYFQIANR